MVDGSQVPFEVLAAETVKGKIIETNNTDN
jgi:hypothetical protein